MKRIALVLFLSLSLHPSSFGQGALTPPGRPGPTMKALEQLEPRTPISSLPFTITQPGSYYLTTNLIANATVTNGITITVSEVTLDLMGFELVGDSGDGIFASGTLSNITIRNGTVRNWTGRGLSMVTSHNSQLERLRVSSNGQRGIYTGLGSAVRDCTARGNGGDGIRVNDSSRVVDNTCDANGDLAEGAGVRAFSSRNRVEGNHLTANDWGIRVITGGNLIIRNSASNITTNYSFTGVQTFGPTNHLVGTGGVITNAHPWANFSFY